MRTVYRYEVPVDDQPHPVQVNGDVRAVGCRDVGSVEFWADHYSGASTFARTFQVFGTGHPVPPHATYIGTAVAPGGRLVWHLFELVGVGIVNNNEQPTHCVPGDCVACRCCCGRVCDDVPPNAGSTS